MAEANRRGKLTADIHLNMTPRQKRAWEQVAREENRKLSNFMRHAIDSYPRVREVLLDMAGLTAEDLQ